MRGDSVLGTGSDSTEEDEWQETEEDLRQVVDSEYEECIRAYQTVLRDVYYHQRFPNGRDLGYDELFDITNNKFALEDIDGDGKIELLLVYTTTYNGGMAEIIYDYDSTTGIVREEFIAYPSLTYYGNGIIQAESSHNHGIGGRFWPYTLYQYNKDKDIYEEIAKVDAWDKEVTEEDSDGTVFPKEIDRNGDGLIYYIMTDGTYERKNPVDLEEYRKWQEFYIKETERIMIPYKALTEENIDGWADIVTKEKTM